MSENAAIQKQLEKLLPRLSEIIASANINFLIGSGVSKPYLPTLNNIEKDINNASSNEEKAEKYKEYFEKVMLPNKNIISGKFTDEKCYEWNTEINDWIVKQELDAKKDYLEVSRNYKDFLITLSSLILDRKTTVLGKQVNIFTTNIDIFFEQALEDLELHYNDGFSGKMNPVFDLSNFKQSIIQRSHHFDNRSEIPVFNLLKIHGSLTWKYRQADLSDPDRKIFLSSDFSHFENSLWDKIWTDFIEEYKKTILVVNPEDAKFSETVLNKYYYELLRSYSSELERENSVLFVIGFSMADQHIREITKRAARSNPTLQIFIFLYSERQKTEINNLLETGKHRNISIITPEYSTESDKYNYDLWTITNEILKKINFNKKTNGSN